MMLPKSLIIDTYMYYYAHTFTSLIRKKSVGISVDNYMKKKLKT